MRINFNKREWIILSVLVVVKLLIHFLTNSNYDIHRDTFLYYSLGENLDFGYVSVPPFIALLTKAATLLFGYSAFALNFFPAIAGAVSMLVIALVVKDLGGKTFALLIALLAFLLSPAYLRSNSLMQPVSFDQLFWLLSAYFLVRLIKTQNTRYWIGIMIAWGIGFTNKYLIAGYAVSIILALIISRHRKLLLSRHFLIGSLIAFVLVLPNIIWQYLHNWPVVHHLSELSQNQLVNVSMVGFIVDQFMMNIHALLVWFTGLVVFLFFKSERNHSVLSWSFLIVVFLLLVTHGKSYYTLGAYTLTLAMGGYAIEKYYNKLLKPVVLILLILLALPVMPFSLPILNLQALEKYSAPFAEHTNRWEDGEIHPIPQDYSDMTGWKELSDIVIKTYVTLPPEEKKDCVIYAENYGQAGAIYFYGKSYNLPQPISFSDNYLLWAPDSIMARNMIYVNDEVGDIKFLFNNYEIKGVVNNPYFRENGVQVYYCSQPTDTLKSFYNQKVKELKSVYLKN